MRIVFTKDRRSPFAGSIRVALVIGAAASWGTAASAQTQVPQEMRSKAMSLAQVCRTDYEQHCHDVQPGGGRVLGCLSANAEKLSPACRDALPDARALASRAAATGVMPK
jgi:Cysteine rich repeat